MSDERGDQEDVAELFERFFESVSYHGMKRGMARFAKGLSPGQPAPSRAGDVDAELEEVPSPDGTRLPAGAERERAAIPPPAGGKLPAQLIKRLGRNPKQEPGHPRDTGEAAPEETRDAEP